MLDDPRHSARFTVPGDPVPKGRPRFARSGRAYTPKRTLDAEAIVREAWREHISEPFAEPVGIDLVFYCATKRRTDADNLAKLTLDSGLGIAYTDDYLIEELRIRVHRRVAGELPRTEVRIYSLILEAAA